MVIMKMKSRLTVKRLKNPTLYTAIDIRIF